MSKFGHLKKYDINREKTIEYPLYQLEGEPVLILSPATESNKPFYNALLKKARKNIRVAQSGNVNANVVKQNREDDKGLYAAYVLKGWRNMLDNEGNEILFCKEDAEDFLRALPDWIFDDIRNFATNVQNFIEDQINVEDTAKN